MTWSKAEEAHYEAAKIAGKVRTAARRLANTGRRCHLCKGGGERFEMDGWAAPAWEPCYLCDGTGIRQPDAPGPDRAAPGARP